ncbi:MAG: HlyD family type I secretion periplasmic adaptor subunit [Pseudomonadota bacterium]
MTEPSPTTITARLPILIGALTAAGLIGGLAAWSLTTQLSGAIIAPGVVQVETERQVVQHPDGGPVREIRVRDGDRVAEGDVLLRLDDTFLKTELAIVERQLTELFVRKRRLEAERDLRDTLAPGDVPRFTEVSAVQMRAAMDGQQQLLSARMATMEGEVDQLRRQQEQVSEQVTGLEAQLRSVSARREIARDDVASLTSLFERGLSEVRPLRNANREVATLDGEAGRLTSAIAEARSRHAQLTIEELRLQNGVRSAAVEELRDLSFEEIELAERQLSLRERLSRLDVRAPVAGRVFELTVASLNAVVQPAEQILYIIPEDRPIQVMARIRPVDIDQVEPGQDVHLVFSAFDRRTTPELAGRIDMIAADTARDDLGNVYYEAVIKPTSGVADQLGGETVVPGMPVETFIVTGARTPLEYLIQPLSIYFNRALRDG